MSAASPPGAPSRYIGNYSTSLTAPRLTPHERRWRDLRHVSTLFPGEGVSSCSRAMSPAAGERLEVCRRVREDGPASAFFRGLITCSSVWLCPICSARISERRALDLHQAVKRAEALGWQVVLVTLTFAHRIDDRLRTTLARFGKAIGYAHSGRAWTDARKQFGWLGAVRSFEVTHGRNGWHPHAHELWFFPAGVDVDAWAAVYRERWMRALDHSGLSANEHGFRCDRARGSIAQYVSKYGREPRWGPGRELAKSAHKRGRSDSLTPFQLLSLSAEGVAGATVLFREYGEAVKGRRQLQWSPGLRAALSLGAEESDQDALAAADAAPAEIVCTLTPRQWYQVYFNDAEASVLMLAELGDGARVLAYVDKLWAPGAPQESG